MLGLHEYLRDGTRDAHAAVDAAFGSLDLTRRDDYVRFLTAHYMAVAPLQPVLAGFAKRHLDMAAPDYRALLGDDLAALNVKTEQLPLLEMDAMDERGASYVLAGSRLGMSMIRRRGYWGATAGRPSDYMEDDRGIAVWKRLLTWFAEQRMKPEQAASTLEAARRCFDFFRIAFAASKGVKG
jgi:heme oxygenase